MILLKQIATAQQIKFIPTRNGKPNELILKNETTGVQSQYYIDCTTESFYTKFSKILDLKEGHFYTLTINENSDKTNIDNFASRVVADGGTYEGESCLYVFYSLFAHTTTLIHLDKVFVTNQEIDTYSINKNEYVQNSSNIIFYE